MIRKKEIAKVKKIIKKYYKEANCGIFDTRNVMGDKLYVLYDKNDIRVEMCYYYSYFEIFGTTDEEFIELKRYYKSLGAE